ncbi:hypothetical protein ABC337_15330 [Arthrobacter sp. 1P04PC]|uniref:hypothetical protein n=1 Tax=unclassified Arthrobacter TaxID=235627 RepID=UPI0039A01C2B
MNQTHPVGATTHHTEQTLKNRYQEALDILKALEDREAVSGGSALAAVLVEKSEALDWVERTARDLHEFRAAHRERAAAPGWARPHGRGGVIGHG